MRTHGTAGQILPIFAVSLTVLVAMAGMAIDAGGVYAQRRTQQVASDLAALAGANDYLINGDDARAIDRARAVATQNGYTSGVDGSLVDVTIDTSNGVEVTVEVDGVHENALLRVVGLATFDVTTSAAALAGFPDTAHRAAPFIFSISAFEDDGTPRYQTATDFGHASGDVPTGALDLAWTNYGTGNVDTNEVHDIIDGTTVVDKTLTYGEYIGQHNSGNHTALYEAVDAHLSGQDLPVAIVDASGNFMGWAMFHVNSASGGSSKHVNGYFLSSFSSARLTVSSCAANDCPRYLGTYVLKLSG